MLELMFFSVLMDATWLDSPAGSNTPSEGDDEIRATRNEFADRLDQEHVVKGVDSTGASIHRKGSAVDYYQETAPTLRPDGVTALTAADYGRRWTQISTRRTFVYTASGWLKTDPVIELLAADPVSPVTGQIWYRTDV